MQRGLHRKDLGPLCFSICICLHVCFGFLFELLIDPFSHSVFLKLPVMGFFAYFFVWLTASFIQFFLEKMHDMTSVSLNLVRLVCGLQCDLFWRMFYLSVLEKNVYFPVLGQMLGIYLLEPSSPICHSKPQFPHGSAVWMTCPLM